MTTLGSTGSMKDVRSEQDQQRSDLACTGNVLRYPGSIVRSNSRVMLGPRSAGANLSSNCRSIEIQHRSSRLVSRLTGRKGRTPCMATAGVEEAEKRQVCPLVHDWCNGTWYNQASLPPSEISFSWLSIGLLSLAAVSLVQA